MNQARERNTHHVLLRGLVVISVVGVEGRPEHLRRNPFDVAPRVEHHFPGTTEPGKAKRREVEAAQTCASASGKAEATLSFQIRLDT